MKKILILISVLVGAVSMMIAVALTAFAEDDFECSGRIEGVVSQVNPNVGNLTFDAHYYWKGDKNEPEGGVYRVPTDLSLVGVSEQGLAPGNGTLAACITDDSASVEGYAWLTNGGFVSFSCDGSGGVCGDYSYGVSIGDEVGGKRFLSGEAWNEIFGYMKFDNGVANGDVYVDSDGVLHGYAWSDAKVWVDFNGVRFVFPGQKSDSPLVDSGVCDGQPYVCVEVALQDPKGGGAVDPTKDPYNPNNPEGYDVQAVMGALGNVAIADGDDGYEIHLYLREENGVDPMDLGNYVFGDIVFHWLDTVKIQQLAGEKANSTLWRVESPWDKGSGAVVYKPVKIKFPNDFKEVGPGHWILNNTIRSYAPTTRGNISMTTSFTPNTKFQNEFFFTDLGDSSSPWTLPGNIEANELILNNISFNLKTKAGEDVFYNGKIYPGVTFADRKVERSFEFRPAAYLSQLYVDDLQDSIDSYRGIPFILKLQAKMVGALETVLSQKPEVELKLDYDLGQTIDECGSGADFELIFQDIGKSDLNYGINELNNLVKLAAIAELKKEKTQGEDQDEQVDEAKDECKVVEGPTFYSIVSYTIGNEIVKYYSNKLPRVATAIGNPDVVVHGNIYAPDAFTPTHKTQTGGVVGSELIRNAVSENLAKSLGGASPKGGGTCTISQLEDYRKNKVSCTGGSMYELLRIGEEQVLYFKGSDVVFDLNKWENKWVVVVEGGRIFIDKNIYNAELSDERKMSIVGLMPYDEECADNNVYIHSDVTNVQMNLVTDCSVFSYVDKKDLDNKMGVPEWEGFSDRVNALGKQLLLQGSFMSRNTIGGSDRPERAVDGFGKAYEYPLSDENRLSVQNFDWNYMRVGKGELQYGANGAVIDQICGKALSVEDMIAIKQGESVYGIKNGQSIPCNGIQPSEMFDPATNTGGDLVPKTEGLALGLDPQTQTNPVYIFYVAPSKDSFVFKKAGGLSN